MVLLKPKYLLTLFLLASLLWLANVWVNSAAWHGHGPTNYPNNDCGHNWWWLVRLDNGQVCTKGGFSDEVFDRQLEEAHAYDLSPAACTNLVCTLLKGWERLWASPGR